MERSTPRALAFLDDALHEARTRGLLRERQAITEGGPVSFCSNDYLGLAHRMAVAGASGAGASRLVSGDRWVHAALEEAAAGLVRQAASLVFTSGYAANVGLLSALAGPEDLIVSDALNHASLIDGARLSRARVVVTPHLDVGAVQRALEATQSRRAFVVTESYFSMDADSPDLVALRSVCDAKGAALLVDEAHALGVLGPDGRGICAQWGVCPDALIGTFGKAFGAGGAFVAGCPSLVAWLWNRARSFVFSTGLSPVVAACALGGLRTSLAEPHRRERVCAAAERLRLGMVGAGARPVGHGHIVPWIVGDPAEAVSRAAALQARGVDVRAIRPPSVPPGTARLRFTVTAAHSDADIDVALQAIGEVGRGHTRETPPGVALPAKSRQDVGRSDRPGGRLIVIGGTGTSIGKTHVSEALIRAWRQRVPDARIAGIKPVESGVERPVDADARRLSSASTFHVKQSAYSFPEPLSPHLAARLAGTEIRIDLVARHVESARLQADGVVVELAGGLFTPLAAGVSNADLLRALAPDAFLLVAPDRLGVLHDVAAAARAAAHASIRIHGVILVAPPQADASTGRNADEVPPAAGLPVLAVLPRASAADSSTLNSLLRALDSVGIEAPPALGAMMPA